MDIKDIRYFIAIAQERSMSQAARNLFISQPTLSLVVKKIEQEFNTKLFVREGNTLTLTAAGQQLLQRGRALLAEHEAMEAALRNYSCDEQETVRFGISSFYCRQYIPDLFLYFINNRPSTRLEPTELSSAQLEQKVISGDLEFCFVPASPQRPELAYRTIDIEEFLLAVPRNHPANRFAIASTGRPYMDLAILRDSPFILQSAASKQTMLQNNIFQHFGFTPNVIFETSVRETMYALTSYGLGVCILPEIMANSSPDGQGPCFYRIAGIDTTRRYSVAYLPHKKFTPAEEQLIEVLEKLIVRRKQDVSTHE